jgi:hypothetical protein
VSRLPAQSIARSLDMVSPRTVFSGRRKTMTRKAIAVRGRLSQKHHLQVWRISDRSIKGRYGLTTDSVNNPPIRGPMELAVAMTIPMIP